MLVICRPLPVATPAAMAPHLAEEIAELRKLRAAGTLLEAFSPGGPGAVLILETADAPSATAIAEALPLRRAQLISTEVVELHSLGL